MRRFKSRRKRFMRKGKRYGVKSMVRKVVNKALSKNMEHKYFDYQFASPSVDDQGITYYISDVPQGDTDTTRDGDKLMPTSLDLNLAVYAGDTTNVVRFMIVRWHSNVSTLAAGNVFQYLNSAYAPHTPLHHDGRSQFEVLLDKTIVLNTVSRPIVKIVKRLILAKKTIKYSAGSTTGSDKILALAVSDSAATSHPAIAGYSRLNFTDG